MQRYNYDKLLGKIKERHYTQERLAVEMGISACSLNLTLNNKRNFRQDEILTLTRILKIPSRDIEDYFFTHVV